MFNLHKLNSFQDILVILLILGQWSSVVARKEILELSCLSATSCKQFENANIRAKCDEGYCVCKTLGGEHVQCEPQNLKLSNIIGGHCPCKVPNTECNKTQNLCFCKDGYITSESQRECIEDRVSIGSKCEKDYQCQLLNPYTVCNQDKHICECSKSFFINPNSKVPQCVSAVLNSNCSIDAECESLHPTAICVDEHEHCACAFTHVVNSNGSRCLMTKGYQQLCSETLQCIKQLGPGGVCKDGQCECNSEDYHPKELETGTVCKRNGKFGEYCKDNNDCYQTHLMDSEQTLVCSYHMCNCKYGYNYIEKICNGAFSINVDRFMTAVYFAILAVSINIFV